MKPAIILSSHTIGLGPIRSLGIHGVPVIVVYYNQDDMGYVSKYVTRRILVPHPEKYEEKFLDILVEMADEYGGGMLLPADDQTLLVVSKNKHLLSRYYVVACTDWEISQKYLDKKFTYELAEKIGVPAPRTRVLKTMDDAEHFGREVEYPCILKPSVGHHYFEIFKQKMVRVENFDSMLAEFRLANDHNIEMMLQEFIPGNDTHGVNYNTYFWEGESRAEFTAEKVRLSPPNFGVPRVLISKVIPELAGPGSTFLKALGYYGYSCTEFKRDARSGQYKLMEVNGRVNLSTLHAVKCGIDFPWIMYDHLMNDVLPDKPAFTPDIYWIDSSKDIISSICYYRQEHYPPFDYIRPYLHPKAWAILSFSDPMPYIKRWKDIFKMGFSSVFMGKGVMEPSNAIYIEGNGCIKRMLEVSTLKQYFTTNGYEIVDDPEKAGTILISTCMKRGNVKKQSLDRLQVLKSLPAELIVYGCLPKTIVSQISEYPNIHYLNPSSIERIDEFFGNGSHISFRSIPYTENVTFESKPVPVRHGVHATINGTSLYHRLKRKFNQGLKKWLKSIIKKSRTDEVCYIVIGSGCTEELSYCYAPIVHGDVHSKSPNIILEEFIRGLGKGYRSFKLLSDDSGIYGSDIGTTFPALLTSLYNEAEKQAGQKIKIHLEDITAVWLIPHVEELQRILGSSLISGITLRIGSGNDRLLGLMRANYTQKDLRELVSRLRKINSNLRISASFIVGYPSETAQEYQETLSFIHDMHFDHVQLFSYCQFDEQTDTYGSDVLSESIIEKRITDGLMFLKSHNISGTHG